MRAGADPTTTAHSKFDPQNVLDVLESVYDFYAKEIGFLDTSIGSPSKYKFIIEISNTWRDASINGWAYGGYITSTKGVNIGWMQKDTDATKGGNGLAHEFFAFGPVNRNKDSSWGELHGSGCKFCFYSI